MRFLVDNALSPVVARGLLEAGYDAVHVRDFQMQAVSDDIIFDYAANEERVIISADTDFGRILAQRDVKKPSVILLRWPMLRKPGDQTAVLLKNIPNLASDLQAGSVVVIEETRVRVRALPIGSSNE